MQIDVPRSSRTDLLTYFHCSLRDLFSHSGPFTQGIWPRIAARSLTHMSQFAVEISQIRIRCCRVKYCSLASE